MSQPTSAQPTPELIFNERLLTLARLGSVIRLAVSKVLASPGCADERTMQDIGEQVENLTGKIRDIEIKLARIAGQQH